MGWQDPAPTLEQLYAQQHNNDFPNIRKPVNSNPVIQTGTTGSGQSMTPTYANYQDELAKNPSVAMNQDAPQAEKARYREEQLQAQKPGPNAGWEQWAHYINNFYGTQALAQLSGQGWFNQFKMSPEEQQGLGSFIRTKQDRPDDIFFGNTGLDTMQVLMMIGGAAVGGASGWAGGAAGGAAEGTGAAVYGGLDNAAVAGADYGLGATGTGTGTGLGEMYAQGGNTAMDFTPSAGTSMPPAQGLSPAELQNMGLQQSTTNPGLWQQPGNLMPPAVPYTETGLDTNYEKPVVNSGSSLDNGPGMETDSTGGYTNDPNYTPGSNEPMMQQDFNSPVNSGASSGSVGQGGINPSGGSSNPNSGFGWNPQTVQAGLGVGGGLYSIYNYGQQKKSLEEQRRMMEQQQSQNAQLQQMQQGNWDLVDQYLRDPMALLRNNPGYLASVDFVEKEGRRQAAKGGYNISGNKGHYLADVLGKNAESWYNRAWTPIRDAAGLGRPDQSAQLDQGQMNATNTINNAKNQLTHRLFETGTAAVPSLFKMFESA